MPGQRMSRPLAEQVMGQLATFTSALDHLSQHVTVHLRKVHEAGKYVAGYASLNEKLEECKNLQEQLDDLYQDYDILQSNATMDFKDNSEYWGSLAETDNEAVKVKKNKKMIRLRKKLRDRGGIEI